MRPILQVLAPGAALSAQDAGRTGFKSIGAPGGGFMDRRSAWWANRLVGNDPGTPLLEMLPSGFSAEALGNIRIALCGAEVEATHPQWRTVDLKTGEHLKIKGVRRGVWLYLGVAGGIAAPGLLESVSPLPGMGTPMGKGTILESGGSSAPPESGSPGRFTPMDKIPRFDGSPALQAHPGPQWDLFQPGQRKSFLEADWKVSPRSSRAGYRLEGTGLSHALPELASEPVRTGAVQVTPDGTLIVLMRDGPTVGGYPKLAVLDPSDLDRFAQCAPGKVVRFRMAG